jgi:hypothetical protein
MLVSVERYQAGLAVVQSQWIDSFQLSWRNDGERADMQHFASHCTL